MKVELLILEMSLLAKERALQRDLATVCQLDAELLVIDSDLAFSCYPSDGKVLQLTAVDRIVTVLVADAEP